MLVGYSLNGGEPRVRGNRIAPPRTQPDGIAAALIGPWGGGRFEWEKMRPRAMAAQSLEIVARIKKGRTLPPDPSYNYHSILRGDPLQGLCSYTVRAPNVVVCCSVPVSGDVDALADCFRQSALNVLRPPHGPAVLHLPAHQIVKGGVSE